MQEAEADAVEEVAEEHAPEESEPEAQEQEGEPEPEQADGESEGDGEDSEGEEAPAEKASKNQWAALRRKQKKARAELESERSALSDRAAELEQREAQFNAELREWKRVKSDPAALVRTLGLDPLAVINGLVAGDGNLIDVSQAPQESPNASSIPMVDLCCNMSKSNSCTTIWGPATGCFISQPAVG